MRVPSIAVTRAAKGVPTSEGIQRISFRTKSPGVDVRKL